MHVSTQPLILDKAQRVLRTAARPVLGLAVGWSAVDDPTGAGLFLRQHAAEPAPYVEQALGTIAGLKRFTSLYRFSPFWTRPAMGRSESELQPETLWLLAQAGLNAYTIVVPLLDEQCRYSLRGASDGLAVLGESGDPMQPDWDMFHSAHPRGAFHAAARAVSGGPVYVSDAPGAHDAQLLRKLVLSDGSVLRADLPGRPSPDTLFADPTRDATLLKVFKLNRDCGVLGLFHASSRAEPISGTLAIDDVPGLTPGRAHMAWAHRAEKMWRCVGQPVPLTLAPDEWEIVSFAPVELGFAALGLADKFNSTGAIVSRSWQDGAGHHLQHRTARRRHVPGLGGTSAEGAALRRRVAALRARRRQRPLACASTDGRAALSGPALGITRTRVRKTPWLTSSCAVFKSPTARSR
jgi:Raffinose synthase or seed imbibition protein Sip1